MTAAAVVSIAASAPSSTLSHAQVHQISSTMSAIEEGRWLLPRNPVRGLNRKPPLYVWLAGPVLKLTEARNDLVFRVPTLLSLAGMAVLIYVLGRRWYGRRVGLLAACLWLTALHMGKLSYMALTDMLFAFWITAAVLCVDSLLFHRTGRGRKWPWVVGLWATMILGSLTKGWGLVNGTLVGGMAALATAVGPGFRPVRLGRGWAGKVRVGLALVLRRWRRAARALHLGWGAGAMLAVMVPLLGAMWILGGEEFRQVVYMEVWQRLTGTGRDPPRATSMPAVLQLLYRQVPSSILAIAALLLVKPRHWFSRRGPIWLPLCWIVAVVTPFSLTHGFRPDYLLPCYAAVALMGAWAVDRLASCPPQARARASFVRHLVASAPVLILLGLIVAALGLLVGPYLPGILRHADHLPAWPGGGTGIVILVILASAPLLLAAAIRASLRWRLRRLAGITVVAMLGVLFMDRHVFCTHARTRDGERAIRFAREAGQIIGDQPWFIYRTNRAAAAIYIGRSGLQVDRRSPLKHLSDKHGPRWLVTSDFGLIRLGAWTSADPNGHKVTWRGKRFRFHTKPEVLGVVRLATDEPLHLEYMGRLYLIELQRPPALPAPLVDTAELLSDDGTEADEEDEGY